MLKRLIRVFILPLLLFFSTGCDIAYPPIIVNLYDQPVKISIIYEDPESPVNSIELEPKVEFFHRRKGSRVGEMNVKTSAGELRTYPSGHLEQAREKFRTDYEVWVFSERGLDLKGKEFLLEFQKNRRR
jgi:hypothetical protein